MTDKINVGDFVFHDRDGTPNEKLKMLVIEALSNDNYCCRYIHYKVLNTIPNRLVHISMLTKA